MIIEKEIATASAKPRNDKIWRPQWQYGVHGDSAGAM